MVNSEGGLKRTYSYRLRAPAAKAAVAGQF